MNIGVVIPTYNRCDLIGRALQSVCRQTLPASEIVVVDDGSTDGTADLVSQFQPTVKLIRQGCQGVSAARNRGIESTTAEWIAFLDSDDEWDSHKLERQAAVLSAESSYRFCHTDEIWIRNGVQVNPMDRHAKPTGQVFDQCLPLCCISPSTVVLHRSVLERCGRFDESLPACEDYDLWLRIALHYSVLLVGEKLVTRYGGHQDQLSKRHWGMDRFRVRALEKLLESGELSERQRKMVIETLTGKIEILLKGFNKRNNHQQIRHYQDTANRWLERAQID